MNKPLRLRTIALGFVLACLLIGWIGILAYWNTHELVRSFDSVARSHLALEKLQTIRLLMETAESSVCSYIITGRPEQLAGYREAQTAIPRKLRQVETLVNSLPGQKKTFRRLHRLLSSHLAYLDDAVAARESEGFESASKWIASEDISSTREALDHLLTDLQAEEGRVVQRRSTSTSEHSSQTKSVLIFAAGVIFGLLAWVFSLLYRETGGRRKAESTTQRLESFLQSIVERIPYMVLVKEATHLRLMLVNKAATEWLGRPEEDLLDSNEYDLRPREEAELAMQKDRDVLRTGQSLDIPEEPFLRAGKEPRILHTQKIIIPNELGDPAYLLTISEDITEQKQAEQMLKLSRDTAIQSERLKSEFIRNMSHEIRTPLSVVIGMASLLLGTELTQEQQGFAAKAKRAADGLSILTKDILDFSKIETGTFTLEIQEMNVRQNIEGILTMLREQVKTKGVELARSIPENVPATIYGDPVRVRQVLTQLVGNAVKFTPRGQITLHVNQERESEDLLWLTYRVSDTGLGIPEDAQKHLFEPFRQGDGSPTRKFGGTGLGLALSKRIVELMGGEIGFNSVPGQGSTFWFTVPFKKRPNKNEGVHEPPQVGMRSRILVVEENETARQLLRQQLGSLALSSEGVSSGESALELLRHEQKAGRPFPIVLLAMHLADMDAIAFARTIKTEEALTNTKLLVMSSSPLEPSTVLSLGFAGLVPKPPKPEALYERLSALIDSPDKNHEHAA